MPEIANSEILAAAEEIHDGWYADKPVDWQNFIDRLESYTDVDFGTNMDSALIKAVKKHIRAYRKSG